MRVRLDLPPVNAWENLCEQYRAALPTEHTPVSEWQNPALQVQVYQGYSHAVWEVARGLAELFSHKKTIAIPADAEPAIERVAESLSQEGVTVKTLTKDEMHHPDGWLSAGLQTDLLFVLTSEDDSVTSELFSLEKIDAALKDKRIFHLKVSHASHRCRAPRRPLPYEGRILSLAPDRALFLGGERCRVQPAVARLLPWPENESERAQRLLHPLSPDHQDRLRKRVGEIEALLSEKAGFGLAFKTSKPGTGSSSVASEAARVFDRVVFWHHGVDGLSLAAELSERWQAPVTPTGMEGVFEATTPCRWLAPRYHAWLLKRGYAPETIRGLVILSAEYLLERPDAGAIIVSQIQAALGEILRLQNGA